MFEMNDTILYGTDGVCLIADITKQKLGDRMMEYYVLKPVYQDKALIYVPTENATLQAKMRRILSAEEIHRLIESMPEEDALWIDNEEQRKAQYRAIIQSGDRQSLIRLIKALYQHQQQQKEAGRKFHVCDERFMKEAEKILYDEFAHVLQLEPDQVLPFILKKIRVKEREAKGSALA